MLQSKSKPHVLVLGFRSGLRVRVLRLSLGSGDLADGVVIGTCRDTSLLNVLCDVRQFFHDTGWTATKEPRNRREERGGHITPST